MFAQIKSDTDSKMDKVLEVLKKDLAGLRTGRASAAFLNSVHVEVYGDHLPLSNLSTITAQDGNMLLVQVWDKSVVKNVEKAINLADLGVNGVSDGSVIRIPIPPLSEERRKDLVKLAAKYGEQSKVAIRNVRRNSMELIKDIDNISKDDMHKYNDEIQKVTDMHISKIDALLVEKEKDIMKV